MRDRMDEVLDDIETVLIRHFGTAWEIMSVDGDEEGMLFTVSGNFLEKEVDNQLELNI